MAKAVLDYKWTGWKIELVACWSRAVKKQRCWDAPQLRACYLTLGIFMFLDHDATLHVLTMVSGTSVNVVCWSKCMFCGGLAVLQFILIG